MSTVSDNNRDKDVPRLNLSHVSSMRNKLNESSKRANLNESMRSDYKKQQKENAKIDRLFQV